MRKRKSIIRLFGLAGSCLILVGAAGLTFAGEKSGGHLIVNRVANFGSGLFLSLSIDSSKVADLAEGHNYDGYLPPGKHVISAVVSPNRDEARPAKVTIDVHNGETYSFTAVWEGDDLALVKN